MKLNKLKSITLILISILLSIIIIKYLKLLSIFCIFIKLLAPVFIGLIYAWLLNPLITKLSQKHNRNFICITIFILIISFISIILYLLIPTIYKELHNIVDRLPSFVSFIQDKISKYNIDINFDKIGDNIINDVPIYILDTIKRIIKYSGIIAVGLVVGLYASIDYDKLVTFIYKHFPHKHKEEFIKITTKISTEVHKCVNGTLLVSALVFIGDTICFIIIGLKDPFLLGFICGLTDLIPYIGPYIGGGIAILVALSQSKTLFILTIICCICVQLIENNILQPLIMSKAMKISPIFIIIGLLVFGDLFGIVGMILATPLVAILKVVIEYITDKRLKKSFP